MKRILFSIFLCSLAMPTVVMPMNNNFYNGIRCPGCQRNVPWHQVVHLGCGHAHCTDCFRNRITEAIRNGNRAQLVCPNRYCRQQFEDWRVRQFLVNDQELRDEYENLIDPGQMCAIEGEMKRRNELTRLACGHRDCTDCMGDRILQAIQDRNIGQIRCSNNYCQAVLNRNDIVLLLQNDEQQIQNYDRLVRQHQIEQEIANDPVNGRHCPTANCDEAYRYGGVPENRLCQRCNQNYCANCLVQHPLGAQCAARENAADVIRNLNMEARPCPRCQRPIEKSGGCNHMTCRRPGGCGHEFCWLCLGNWEGYHHQCPRIEGANPASEEPWAPRVRVRNRRASAFSRIVQVSVIIGVGYVAYKFYKYLTAPKVEIPPQDLKISLDALMKEVIRNKRMAECSTYVRDTLKNFMAQEELKNAYGNLNEVQLAALKKIIAELEDAFVAGNYDMQYAEFAKFVMDAQQAQKPAEVTKADEVKAVETAEPVQVKKTMPVKKAAPANVKSRGKRIVKKAKTK